MVVEFELVRDEDESGVSGTGIVAEGVILDHGACVMTWFNSKTVNIYDNPFELIDIHGHGGKTRLRAKRGALRLSRGPQNKWEGFYVEQTPKGVIAAHYWTNNGRWVRSIVGDYEDAIGSLGNGLAQGGLELGFHELYHADAE